MSLEALWTDNPSTGGPTIISDAQGDIVDSSHSKYFVRKLSSKAAGIGSALSGDDNALPGPKPAGARKRTVTNPSLNAVRTGFGDLVEVVTPTRAAHDLILNSESAFTLMGVANEVRRADEIRRHGVTVRSKLLFCGPPGCGKSLCAEVVAAELKMPLVIARLDAIIASHLGETATNLRKVFDAARTRSVVLFLDEFDALARARNDPSEHSEIKRVVNSLLMLIDGFQSNSVLIAATNLEQSVDRAVWRRFDEVVVFEKPSVPQIRRLLRNKTKNFPPDFDIAKYADNFAGMSFAQVERVCINAIRASILAHKKVVSEDLFEIAASHEKRRSKIEQAILA